MQAAGADPSGQNTPVQKHCRKGDQLKSIMCVSKYNRQCPLKHIDDICEKPDCHVSKCDLRHQKDFIWFRDFQRCKGPGH